MTVIDENALADFENPSKLQGGSGGGAKFKTLKPYSGTIVELKKIKKEDDQFNKGHDQFCFKIALDDWGPGSKVNPEDPDSPVREEQWHHSIYTRTQFTPGKGGKLEKMFQGILDRENVSPQDAPEIARRIKEGARVSLVFNRENGNHGPYDALIAVMAAE